MKYLVAFGLLVTLTSVFFQCSAITVSAPRPVGVIYLMELFNQSPQVFTNEDESSNVIPSEDPYRSRLLYALNPNTIEKDKDTGREKRSPSYKGGGGGGCNTCGGGGGGYPGGGGGYGGGHGSSGSWSSSSSQSSAGSWGSGGGKGGYHG